MSEYAQLSRRTIIWRLPMATGLKYIAAIRYRMTGEDSVTAALTEAKDRQLAELQAKYAEALRGARC